MGRRRHHEEHINHEAWAIPYADLMTLLLAFFVVMYAVSSLNEGKYRVLADSLTSAFTGTPKTMDPIQVGDSRPADAVFERPMPVQQSQRVGARVPSALADTPLRPMLASRSRAERGADGIDEGALAASRRQLSRIAIQLEDEMADLIRTRTVTIRRTDLWLEVEINSDILFDTASDVLEPGAQALLSRLAGLLRDEPNPVRVEGHTDDRPIRSLRFPSNWELSAARAASVVHLFVREAVAPQRLVMVGYGEHRPRVAGTTEAARNANRRVVLMVLAAPDHPEARPADVPESLAAQAPGAAPAPAATAAQAEPAPHPHRGEG